MSEQKSHTRFLPLTVFALIALVFIILMWRQSSGDYDPSALPSALRGKPVPAYTLPSLDGEQLTEASLPGTAYLLNVWATWCISCKAEHPYLNQLHKSGIPIVGLNYKDDVAKARIWLERLGDPYQQHIVDVDGTLALDLGVSGAPETFVVDQSGRIRLRIEGPLNERRWRKEVIPLGIEWGIQ